MRNISIVVIEQFLRSLHDMLPRSSPWHTRFFGYPPSTSVRLAGLYRPAPWMTLAKYQSSARKGLYVYTVWVKEGMKI